jgi:hypothetical protein
VEYNLVHSNSDGEDVHEVSVKEVDNDSDDSSCEREIRAETRRTVANHKKEKPQHKREGKKKLKHKATI